MNQDNIDKMYCYNHPQRETRLRCNKCDRPICSSCAVLTPTGYRCKECVRGQQKIFDTARWWDYPVGAAVSFILSLIGSVAVQYIGFFAIILSFFVGIGVAEAVRFALRKRRSRYMPLTIAISAFIGGIFLRLILFPSVFSLFSYGIAIGLINMLWPTLYAVIVAGTAYYRLKGIRL